jgi:hypothetical protein
MRQPAVDTLPGYPLARSNVPPEFTSRSWGIDAGPEAPSDGHSGIGGSSDEDRDPLPEHSMVAMQNDTTAEGIGNRILASESFPIDNAKSL